MFTYVKTCLLLMDYFIFKLLYRCVHAVNLTHDNAHAQMDVKLRSLVCLGLNEQVLHLWLEVLCSSVEVVKKW